MQPQTVGSVRNDGGGGYDSLRAPGPDDNDDEDTLITPLATSLTETEEEDASSVVDVTVIAAGFRQQQQQQHEQQEQQCLLVETAAVVASSSTSDSSDSSLLRSSPSPELPELPEPYFDSSSSSSSSADDDGDNDHAVTNGDNGHSSIDSADIDDRLVTPPPTASVDVRAATHRPAVPSSDYSAPSSSIIGASTTAGVDGAGFKSNLPTTTTTPASPPFTQHHQPADESRDSNGSHTLAQELRFSRAYENFFDDDDDRRRSRGKMLAPYASAEKAH